MKGNDVGQRNEEMRNGELKEDKSKSKKCPNSNWETWGKEGVDWGIKNKLETSQKGYLMSKNSSDASRTF